MNESIRPRGELKMTVVCKTCENQYGAWRNHCPTCGTSTPITKREAARPKKQRECKSQCICCYQRGAKAQCPHCEELIHSTCLIWHVDECERYQKSCEEWRKSHESGTTEGVGGGEQSSDTPR